MLEMASAGAKVLQPRAVEFAKRYGSRIHVRSSLTRSRGTMVIEEVKCMEKMLVSGVAGDENQAKITILSVPDRPGIAAKIFRALAAEGINVDMIIQSAGEQGRNDISFTVARDDLKRSLRSLGDVAKELGSRGVVSDDGVAKVSIVGIGMRTHPGVAAKMFETLASGRINIEMISTSEIKISCIVRREELHKAMRLLHDAFGLGKKRKGR
jgi:aspartate kinase